MNRHDNFQQMLVFPNELSPEEHKQLVAHLRMCPMCRKEAETRDTTMTALAAMRPISIPTTVRHQVEARIASNRSPQRWKLGIRRPVAWTTAFAGALIAVVMLFGVFGQRTATPVNAYTILQRASQSPSSIYPYSGSARVRFSRTPWYLLPPEVTRYAGRFDVTTRWWVQNPQHFRVDVQVVSPALERGRITAVLNGRVLTMYDDRSGKATILHGTPFPQLRMTAPQLLSFFQNGAQFNQLYNPSPVAPNSSVAQYLTALRTDRSRPGVHPYAHVVRQSQILGHPVDVVDFAPLSVMSYDSGGCYPTTSAAPHATPVVHPPGDPCHHYTQALGWGRVFIARDHPLVLRFEEHGITDVENVLLESIKYRYDVTALHLRTQPPPRVLQYKPPVAATTVTRVAAGLYNPGIETVQGGDNVSAPGFVRLPQPTEGALAPYERLATTWFVVGAPGPGRLAESPLPVIRGMDVLFSQVRRWVKVYTSWHGQASIYVTGPYVLVQQRQLRHGLPSVFLVGTSQKAARCRIWSGRYADGQRWIAFQRGSASIVMSSNTLTTTQLRGYATQYVCR